MRRLEACWTSPSRASLAVTSTQGGEKTKVDAQGRFGALLTAPSQGLDIFEKQKICVSLYMYPCICITTSITSINTRYR